MADLLFDEVVGECREQQGDDECVCDVDRLGVLPLDDVDEGKSGPVEEVESCLLYTSPSPRD